MVQVLQRYRVAIIIASLVLFGLLMWLFLTRQSTGKIPSRGVFVMEVERFAENLYKG